VLIYRNLPESSCPISESRCFPHLSSRGQEQIQFPNVFLEHGIKSRNWLIPTDCKIRPLFKSYMHSNSKHTHWALLDLKTVNLGQYLSYCKNFHFWYAALNFLNWIHVHKPCYNQNQSISVPTKPVRLLQYHSTYMVKTTDNSWSVGKVRTQRHITCLLFKLYSCKCCWHRTFNLFSIGHLNFYVNNIRSKMRRCYACFRSKIRFHFWQIRAVL